MCDPFFRIHLYICNMLWELGLKTEDLTGWVVYMLRKAATVHGEAVVAKGKLCLLHKLQY